MGTNRVTIVFMVGLILAADSTYGVMDKIVCYYGSWATYRNGYGNVSIEHIDPDLCTNLIYAFVGIEITGEIKILDPLIDVQQGNMFGTEGFKEFNKLKEINPNLKTHISIGGWNEGSYKFSAVASNASTRKVLIDSSISFLQEYGFDGFDLDWQYPGQREGSSPNDKENFVTLIREMREEFDKYDFILSATVAATKTSSDISYDIPAITSYLDFVNLMTYDLHGFWERKTGGNAPLYNGSWEISEADKELNVDACVQSWIERGAPAEKLNLGIGFYGKTFTLLSSSGTRPNSPAVANGMPGPHTGQDGILGFNEICEQLQGGGWTTVMEPEQKFPYSFKATQWVGYDNQESIKIKMDYAKANRLGGAMVWSIETDDVHGIYGIKWPLLKTIRNEIGSEELNNVTTETTPSTVDTTPSTVVTTPSTVVTTPSTIVTTPSTVVTTPSTIGTTPSTSTTTVSTACVPEKPEPRLYPNCLCSQEEFIRDPFNCTVFYYCQMVNGNYIPQKYVCNDGLYYNQAINACDYKEHVLECL